MTILSFLYFLAGVGFGFGAVRGYYRAANAKALAEATAWRRESMADRAPAVAMSAWADDAALTVRAVRR